jgi:ribosomal protein L18
MANDYLAHPDDIIIDRKNENWPTNVVVTNNEGDLLFRFHKKTTDQQIKEALCFANRAYALGIEVGERRKQHQIKAVLGLLD